MWQIGRLLLDLVGAAEHAVDAGKVIRAGNNGVNASLGSEVLLEVSLLTEVAHLEESVSRVLHDESRFKRLTSS